jgi:hypothetical protein
LPGDFAGRAKRPPAFLAGPEAGIAAFAIGGATLISGPSQYLCIINQSFVRNNIPYFFDVCMPSCDPNNPDGTRKANPNEDCSANRTARQCDLQRRICVVP